MFAWTRRISERRRQEPRRSPCSVKQPAKARPPGQAGRILAIKWGYNPNSSSLGVDVTFLLFGMMAVAVLTPLVALFLRARGLLDGSPDRGDLPVPPSSGKARRASPPPRAARASFRIEGDPERASGTADVVEGGGASPGPARPAAPGDPPAGKPGGA